MMNRDRLVKAVGISLTMLMMTAMALTLAGCAGETVASGPWTVDGVTYALSDGWSYDEENRAFINADLEGVSYLILPLEDCDMKSLDERRATFADDDSDGIDKTDIEIAGEKALLTHEPVNEIDDYNIYFYIDGQEHIVNFETDFGSTDHEACTQELIDSIQR